MKNLTCTQAKQIDLVGFLAALGYQPQRIRNNDYWYLSPLREEKTASFKIDRKLNLWYDHGTGQGGDLIDFGTLYYKCSIGELLTRLSRQLPARSLSFQPPTTSAGKQPMHISLAGEKKEAEGSKILILSSRPLADSSLLGYLESRCIPLEIASLYCREIGFSLHNKQHKAVGFANNAGGYELRSKYFKGSSSPKEITYINNHTGDLVVFEGFFNFLSYVFLFGNNGKPPSNYLILNSLSFFQKNFPLMERHETINLYLDRDAAGMECTAQALQVNPRFKDNSFLYKDHKDLNEFLISNPFLKKEKAPEINQDKELSGKKRSAREQLPPFGKGRGI